VPNKRRTGRPSKYPPEFQRDAVAMVLHEGRSIADASRATGVNEGTLATGCPRSASNVIRVQR
jgi:transposase-like protein